MNPYPSSLPKSSKPDLPPASIEAVGCLLLPGCAGNFLIALISFAIILQAAVIVNAWAYGKPMPWLRPEVQPGLLVVVWLILSGIVGSAIRSGNRQKWLYWATAVCLGGWLYMAVMTTAININYPGASDADQRRAGSWLATLITGYVFLRFTLSGRNRAYFGISRK